MSGPRTLDGTACLVLGAGGFIGLHLCRALATAGARLHGFGRPSGFPDALPAMRWTAGEFGDAAALAPALEGAEVVFHLLGGSAPKPEQPDPGRALEEELLASVRLLELCRAAGVRRVVFVSSGGTVYGVPRTLPIAEGHPTDPISAYGIHKLAVEKYLGMHAALHGLSSVVLRAANPFGPFQSPFRGQGVVPALIARRLAGQPVEIWGDGRAVRDFLYVGDLAEALLRAARYDGPARVLNVGSGIGRSVLEVLAAIDGVLGTSGAPVLHRPGRRTDVPANVLDIGLARRELGWEPATGWTDGLRRTADWVAGTYGAAR